MTKFYSVLLAVLLSLIAVGGRPAAVNAVAASPNLVISQFQPGTAANVNDEFIEILNRGTSPVDLNGYRLVYRSAGGSNDVGPFAVWTTPTVLQPGQFYLIASTSYSLSGAVPADLTYNPTTCMCSLSGSAGGLAIRQGAMNTGIVIDAVGWGNATNIFFEGMRTVAPGSGNSQARVQSGCRDTDNNVADFTTLTPFSPRNLASSSVTCGDTGTTLFAAIAANPTSVTPPGSTVLSVTVVPATTPPSTGITVVADLTAAGGTAAQPLLDNGTNGDVTAGDNVFSTTITFDAGTPGGNRTITAAASDGQGRTVGGLRQIVTVNAPLANEDPLLFGNPSGATSDVSNENNYLMPKPQYTLSYNRSKATLNWAAWRLDSSWIGPFNNGSFDVDQSLPAGWYRVDPETDYDEPVYDRGHMVPAADRTNTQVNNSATFLMTNIVPQHPDNNQGPWNDFENYLRSVAQQGNEIYTITGPTGNIGTIGATQVNRIVVPSHTWKVVLVLPNGDDDLRRASSRATRAFGIIIPNAPQNRNTPWRSFRVTVDAVEYLTGYDFFSQIPKNTQELIERKRDVQ
jgi:DNA/RNA endonuclease G (NUC1)